MLFERLMNIIENAGEPEEAARDTLEALREAAKEIYGAGVSEHQWNAAIDALLASADAHAALQSEQREARWPAIRNELEALGCLVSRSTERAARWNIDAPGICLEVDLATNDVDGLWIGPLRDPVDQLPTLVRERMADRAVELAHKARRDALRQDHEYNDRLKAWVPKNGIGPMIKGGGSLPS